MSAQDHELDRFAGALRERAIADARARRLPMRGDGDAVREHIRALVEREAPALSPRTRDELIDRVVTASVGYGPLEPLLADPAIDEIMVNGHDQVWVERGGVLERSDA